MPKDRDQMTPEDPDDAEMLSQRRAQGSGGSGLDVLPGEESGLPPGNEDEAEDDDVGADGSAGSAG